MTERNFVFEIPKAGFKELEQQQEDAPDNVYIVETAMTLADVEELFEPVEEVVKESTEDLPADFIFVNFDIFFHALKLYSQFDQPFRDRLWICLRALYSRNQKQLIHSLNNFQRGEQQTVLNKLKMTSYLFFTCCELNEDKALAFANRPMDNEDAGKKRQRKNKNTLISSAVYHRSKANILQTIVKTLSLKIEPLFESPSEVRTYVNFMLKYVYVLMASMHTFKDDQVLMHHLSEVFEMAIVRFDLAERFCKKVIELLQNSEELSIALATLVTQLIQKGMLDCGLLMGELSRIQINDLSKDNSCPKAVSAFLIEVGKNCSGQMLHCLSTLELMLDQDSHMVRNAVFEILYVIVIENFRQVDNYRDETIRDQILDLMEEYIHDSTGYCRSKVIKFFTLMASDGILPPERYLTLSPKIAGRLEDKSNFVRKVALAFITKVCQILIPCQGLKDIFEAYHDTYEKLKESVDKIKNDNQKRYQEIEGLMGNKDPQIRRLKEQLLAEENADDDDEEDEEEDEEADDEEEAENDAENSDDGGEPGEKRKKKANKKKKKSKKNDEEEEILEEGYADRIDQLVDTKTLVAKWPKIALEMFVYVQTDDEYQAGLVEADEDDLQYDSATFGFNHFRRLLIAKDFKRALCLLPALKRKYGREKEFEENPNNDVFLDRFQRQVDKRLLLPRQIFLFPLLEIAEQNNPRVAPNQETASHENVQAMLDKFHEENQELDRQNAILNKFSSVMSKIEQYDLFHEIITQSLPKIYDMLDSAIINDVLEAIDFFVMAYNLKLKNSEKGIQKMLLLIWNKDNSIKDRLLQAFKMIYMNETNDYDMEVDEENGENDAEDGRRAVSRGNDPNKTTCFREIKNLLVMVKPLNQGELLCAEQLISEMFAKEMFSKTHIDILWCLYRGYIKSNADDQRWAFVVLGMIAVTKPDIILQELQHVLCSFTKMIPTGEDGVEMPDYELAWKTCNVLLRIYPVPTIESGKEFIKLENDHRLFKGIERLILRGLKVHEAQEAEYRSVKTFYNNFALKSIEVLYLYAKFPDRLISEIMIPADTFVREFTMGDMDNGQTEMMATAPITMAVESQGTNFMGSQATTASALGNKVNTVALQSDYIERFLYIITGIMKGFLLHMGFCVLRENQIRKRQKDMSKQREMEERKRRAEERKRGGRAKETREMRTDVMVNDYSSSDDDEANAEFGGSMGNDSTVLDFIQIQIFDKELLNNNGYLSKYYNFAKGITYDIIGKRFSRPVRVAAWHAMCNFMIASKEVTVKHRRTFGDCLSRCPDDEIRAILVTYWGDILMRFPNQIEYLNPKLFDFLRGDSRLLKSCALKTLSMIILADMLKPTGEIIQMAKLIVDQDEEIQNLTRCFFVQIAKKDNQNIYNYLTDVISSHAGSESTVSEADFQEMIRFLFDLLEKHKSTESLVKKLAERFLITKDTRLWRDLSYSLQLVNYQEKSLKALIDQWNYFRTTLTNKQVFDNFQSLIHKLHAQHKESKAPAGAKMIELINDFEAKIKAVRTSGIENQIEERENEKPEQEQPEAMEVEEEE